jgi:hypothetical protein
LIETRATFESSVPSFAFQVKESDPLNESDGVYKKLGAVPESVPC